MRIPNDKLAQMLTEPRYPRSSKYDPMWVIENEMGPNVLWLTESLCEVLPLQPGMRVLDMGCGKALSSVFLAKEFGVQVWATDLWIEATDNWKRIKQAGGQDSVYPIHAEAHSLPFAEGFFDVAVSMDSYHYYGTDDLFLSRFIKYVKPGGALGIVVPGLMQEFDGPVPEHLTEQLPDGSRFWDPSECFSFHTLQWWRRHWSQTQLVDVSHGDTVEDGWRLWRKWAELLGMMGLGYADEAAALEKDRGRYLGFVRLVAHRKT